MISVRSDIREVRRYLNYLERRQIPFAAMNALNTVAFGAQKVLRRHISQTFDRPTRYAINSTRVRKAKKNHLTAMVWIKDKGDAGKGTTPANFLLPHIRGGARNAKRFEIALRRIGILPPGYYATPGSGATLDAYGNMSRGQIVQILAYFRAFGRYSGDLKNSTVETRAKLRRGGRKKFGRAYFVAYPGRAKTKHLFPGIYKREYLAKGMTSLDCVLKFVKTPHYRAGRLDFYGVQQAYIQRNFRPEFERELRRAISTAAARGKL